MRNITRFSISIYLPVHCIENDRTDDVKLHIICKVPTQTKTLKRNQLLVKEKNKLILITISHAINQYFHNFVGQNYSSDKIFVTSRKFRHFCPTKNFVRRKFLSFLQVLKNNINYSISSLLT